MCKWFFEWLKTRGYVRVPVIQQKRLIHGQPVRMDVRNFFVNPDSVELQEVVEQGIIKWHRNVKSWVEAYIDYRREHEDFWELPAEVLALGYADCDGIAILTANLLLAAGEPYYDVMLAVVETPMGWHMTCLWKGRVYDPLFASVNELPPDWRIWFLWNRKNCYTLEENLEEWLDG